MKERAGTVPAESNGENRPVSWTCGTTNIVMAYDRMGRRVSYLETVSGGSPSPATVVTNANHTFVYDGYLCLRRLDAATKKADMFFTWDPAESVATRLLMVEKPGKYKMHVTHDGNKNVSELVFFSGGSGIAAHYEYAPFGAVTASTRSTSVTAYDFRMYNPFRFSSEYADDTLGLVYYNYRHYNPLDGRWTSRDPLEENASYNYYSYCVNRACLTFDQMGLLFVQLLDKFSQTCFGRFITCMGDCIEKNGPEEFLINSIVSVLTEKLELYKSELSLKLEMETTKVIVGYSGVPKTFIAWYYEAVGDMRRANLI